MDAHRTKQDEMEKEITLQKQIDPLLLLRSFWPQATSEKNLTWRILMFIRSAERVDRVFGNDWQRTERPYGSTQPTDLNIDKKTMNFNSNDLHNNPPITWLGRKQMDAVARAMFNRGVHPEAIYSSPALRSVQTSSVIAQLFGIKILIEPGLMEQGLDELNLPTYKLEKEYPIDSSYSPIVSIGSLKNESSFDCKKRLKMVIEKLAVVPRKAPLVIVGHASAQHVACELAHFRETPATTNLSNSNEDLSECEKSYHMPKSIPMDFMELGLRYPPQSVVSLIQHGKVPACDYRLMPNLIPPMTYGHSITTQPIISLDR